MRGNRARRAWPGTRALPAALAAVALAAGLAHAAAGEISHLQTVSDGSNGVDGLDAPVGVAVSPDNRHVYAAGFGDDALAVFSRDPETGLLGFVEKETGGGQLAGAEGVAVSPDGHNVYATGFASDSLAVFARNPASGALELVEAESDGAGPVDGLDGADWVAVAPAGRHVYATGLNDDGLAAFARDPATGTLTFAQVLKDGFDGVDGLDAPENVAVSPNGRNLYATGEADDAVAVFARNPASGALGFVEAEKDGAGGVEGLDGAFGIAVSPDGRHVYASSIVDNAVTVFARDREGGALRWVETRRDGAGGVDGIAQSFALAVSPEGRHVYASGDADDSLAAFRRDPASGSLSLLEVERQGAGGVDASPAYGVAVAPDARSVYATAFEDDGLLAFDRVIGARCGGRRPTRWGTDFADRLRGTGGADVIASLAGSDRVSGLRGRDLVCGFRGADRLRGGQGRDRLAGGAGGDRLSGGKGRDALRGGRGRDRLRGGPGSDRLRGGPGEDSERQ